MPNQHNPKPAQTHRTQPAPRRAMAPSPSMAPPDTQPPTIFARGNLTPGRCFKDTPSGYTPLRSASAKGKICSLGTTLRPASQISTRPPRFHCGSGRGPASEAHSFSQSAPSPASPSLESSSATRLCGPTGYIIVHPPLRIHRIIPCTPQSPIRATKSLFAAVPLWGTGPVV